MTVARNVRPDGSEQVAQNPSLALDADTGTLWLMFNTTEFPEREIAAGRGVRRILVTHSDDHGRTWAAAREITDDLGATAAGWRCTFPAVGHGVQLRFPDRRGWLAFPTYITRGSRPVTQGQLVMVWSDDHGLSWHASEPSHDLGANECMGVELSDGRIYVTVRSYRTPTGDVAPVRDAITFSWDNEWVASAARAVPDLPLTRSGMQAGITRMGSDGPLVLSTAAHPVERRQMTLFVSHDNGDTWPSSRCIDDGPCAYSDVMTLPDGRLAVVYEAGEQPDRLELVLLESDELPGA